MKNTIATLAIIATTACASTGTPSVRVADVADAASTATVLGKGFAEQNPVMTVLGDGPLEVAATSIALKAAGRAVLPMVGLTQDQADATVNASGWLGACNNVALLAGVTFPTSLGFGLTCGALSLRNDRDAFAPMTQGAGQ